MRAIELCGAFLLMSAALVWNREAAGDAVSIYKCEVGGVLTFSDRPCSPQAELHEVDETTVNTYDPPPIAPTAKPKTTVRKPESRRADAQQDKRAETCARVTRSMKDVRSKMRTGYSAKEGERLRDRLAKLKDQQRESRCG
jgi:hypothetical protein